MGTNNQLYCLKFLDPATGGFIFSTDETYSVLEIGNQSTVQSVSSCVLALAEENFKGRRHVTYR